MRIYNFEFTIREVLFFLSISFIVISIFFIVNSKFIAEDQDLISRMNQALIINTKNEFYHGINTDEGYVFSPFTINPISDWKANKFTEIKKDFLMIEKIREEWTLHTYTTTDSKGNTTVHTYHSWDYDSKETNFPEYIMFNGIKIPLDMIDGLELETLDLNSENFSSKRYKISGNYAYDRLDSDVRYYYNVLPIEITGSFFGFLGKEFPYEKITVYEGKQPLELYNYLVKRTKNKNIIRWAIMLIALIAGGIIFCIQENYWLNK